MKIITEYVLNARQTEELEVLRSECGNFEPYLDLELPYYLAYDNDRLIGFLSYIIVNDEAEITALISPAFRRQGIFSTLYKKALTDEPLLSCKEKIAAFPDEMLRSNLCSHLAYSELLLSLESEDASLLPLPATDGFDLCYLEDDGIYLLYDTNEETDNPLDIYENDDAVGSLNLSYNDEFTCIYDVSIEKNRRGCGLATMMMLSFIHEYFATNDKPLILNVRSTNTPAVSLYKKCGFTEVSHIDYYAI